MDDSELQVISARAMPFAEVRRHEKFDWKVDFVSDILSLKLKELELKRKVGRRIHVGSPLHRDESTSHWRGLTCKARGAFTEKAVEDRLGS